MWTNSILIIVLEHKILYFCSQCAHRAGHTSPHVVVRQRLDIWDIVAFAKIIILLLNIVTLGYFYRIKLFLLIVILKYWERTCIIIYVINILLFIILIVFVILINSHFFFILVLINLNLLQLLLLLCFLLLNLGQFLLKKLTNPLFNFLLHLNFSIFRLF